MVPVKYVENSKKISDKYNIKNQKKFFKAFKKKNVLYLEFSSVSYLQNFIHYCTLSLKCKISAI